MSAVVKVRIYQAKKSKPVVWMAISVINFGQQKFGLLLITSDLDGWLELSESVSMDVMGDKGRFSKYDVKLNRLFRIGKLYSSSVCRISKD
ncbi:hypothetical protein ACTXT7_006025 [Hymenolepis weldensis]